MKVMTTRRKNVTVKGQEFEEFERVVYPGSTFCEDRVVRREVRAGIGKALAAFNGLKKLWNNVGVTRKIKLQLFNALVMVVSLYYSE